MTYHPILEEDNPPPPDAPTEIASEFTPIQYPEIEMGLL